jgi:hypothetical protein
MLVAVTDHAAERFRQRVRGTLDDKLEVASRVAHAHAAGRVEPGRRGAVLVRDLQRRDVVYVCRRESADELVVVTLWEQGEDAAVPKRFTDALRGDDQWTSSGSRPSPLATSIRSAGTRPERPPAVTPRRRESPAGGDGTAR